MNKRPKFANHDSKTQKSNCMGLYSSDHQYSIAVRPPIWLATLGGCTWAMPSPDQRSWQRFRLLRSDLGRFLDHIKRSWGSLGRSPGRSPGLLNHQVMGVGSTWVRSWILMAFEDLPVTVAWLKGISGACTCRVHMQVPLAGLCADFQFCAYAYAPMRAFVPMSLRTYVPRYLSNSIDLPAKQYIRQ